MAHWSKDKKRMAKAIRKRAATRRRLARDGSRGSGQRRTGGAKPLPTRRAAGATPDPVRAAIKALRKKRTALDRAIRTLEKLT